MRITSRHLSPLAATALAVVASLGVLALSPSGASAGWYDDGRTSTTTTSGGGYIEPVPTQSSQPTSGVPGRPRAQTSCVWSNAIRVVWDAPAANGKPIQYYEAAAFSYYEGRYVTGRTVSGSARATEVTNLRAGTRYGFKVRARNANGWGEWSATDYQATAR